MDETMGGIFAYEIFVNYYGFKIKHYRGDNFWYSEDPFVDDYKKRKEKFNYCGVGAHHQKCITYTKNKKLAYGTRNILLHAKRRCPKLSKQLYDEDYKSPLEYIYIKYDTMSSD